MSDKMPEGSKKPRPPEADDDRLIVEFVRAVEKAHAATFYSEDLAHVLREREELRGDVLERYAALRGENTFLKNRLRTGTIGGEGSHWVGCEDTRIDCARKVMAGLCEEVKELKWELDNVKNFANRRFSKATELLNRMVEYLSDLSEEDEFEHQLACDIRAFFAEYFPGDVVEPCEESAEKDGGDDA